MMSIASRYIMCVLGLALFFSVCTPAAAEVVDKVSIIVNDEMITESEIQNAMRPVYERYRTMYTGNKLIEKLEEARQKIAEQLINDRVLLSEAKRLNMEVTDKEVEKKIDEMVKRVGTREMFERALAEQRMNIKDIRVRYKEQLMTRKLVDQQVGSRITVSPVDVVNYYNANASEFSKPEEIKVRNILISIKKEPNARKASAQAKEIMKRLDEGCDFDGLAKLYSDGPGAEDGGLMGWVTRGYLLPEIDKVVFNLKEGETSRIIQTSLGYHIFKVEEKKPANTASLSDARQDIEEAVFRQKINEKLKGWIENLKKNAYIAFK